MKKWVLFLGLVSLFGCVDEIGPRPTEAPALPSITTQGIRAAVMLKRTDSKGVVLAVRFDEKSEQLGAYQGRLTFKTSAFTFVDATAAEDGYRLINSEAAGQGVIRFAGFSVDGFTGHDAFEIRLLPKGKFDASALELTIDVVGTIEGAPVPQQQVAVLRGVYSASEDLAR